MILDFQRFVASERPYWTELEQCLERLERSPEIRLSLAEVARLQFLYQKVSSDLARISTFSFEPDLKRYLEGLTAKAYSEIHETRNPGRFVPHQWFLHDFPRVFRKHLRFFVLATIIFSVGAIFGGVAVTVDSKAKSVLVPFEHLAGTPTERVQREESHTESSEGHGTFAGFLIRNNVRVSILSLAAGIAWGFGTVVLVFYNGIILGAVAFEYVFDGQTLFLLGWLLPHGVVEIPSILIASQAGLLLGSAIIGQGKRTRLRTRLREVVPDLAILIFGVACLLVWAGIIESFFSQYHAPVLPYPVKIAFGCAELGVLFWFLFYHGKRTKDSNS